MTPHQKELFGEFVRNIVQAAGTMALYSRQHRMTVAQVSQSLALLNESLTDDDTATVMQLGDDLFVNDLPLDKGPQLDRLILAMTKYRIGHITISRGATYDDIELLLRLVAHRVEPDLPPTPHIRFGAIDVGISPQAEAQGFSSLSAISAELIEGLKSYLRRS